jgi:hypothetical protein
MHSVDYNVAIGRIYIRRNKQALPAYEHTSALCNNRSSAVSNRHNTQPAALLALVWSGCVRLDSACSGHAASLQQVRF